MEDEPEDNEEGDGNNSDDDMEGWLIADKADNTVISCDMMRPKDWCNADKYTFHWRSDSPPNPLDNNALLLQKT